MEAKELRIGNYYNHHGEVVIVTPIVIKCIYESSEIEWCEPIPLTEEWLKKLGFEEYSDALGKHGLYDLKPLQGFTYSIHSKKVIIMQDGNSLSHKLNKEILYVHQLQNIYFALTGNELTIK